MELTLKADKYSHIKKEHRYGEKGDRVKLISDHQGILIVENRKKVRFAVRQDEVKEQLQNNLI